MQPRLRRCRGRRAGGEPLSAPGEKPRHVFLIDGSGFLFRAFHALPPMTRPDGTPVNAVYGFTAMLIKLVDETDADHIAVIFDAGRRTFRNDIYPDYKANRPEAPEELIPQFDLVRDATRAFNVACVEMAGFEADDLIATYARLAVEAGAEVTIVSSDKDLMQLVGDRVRMRDPMKNRDIGPAEVVERFGVGPGKVVDVQALAGDSTDNVPGVAGIGVKTAAQLINEYGDLETVLARAGEIKQPKRRQSLIEQADAARMSLDLVRLKDDVPVDEPIDTFAVRGPEPDALLGFLKEQNFRSLIAKFESRFGAAAPTDTGAPARTPETKADRSYELVVTRPALEGWVDAARQDGIVAVDTETTSLDSMRARLVGVSLSLDDGRACYVPLAHKASGGQGSLDLGEGGGADEDAPAQIPLADAIALLKPLLEDASVLKVGQNIKYDMQVLVRHGIHIRPVDDTMVLSYVLDGGRHGHGMDVLAREHLGIETIKFTDVAGTGKKQTTFDYVPLDKALEYAAEDADVTQRLYRGAQAASGGGTHGERLRNPGTPLDPGPGAHGAARNRHRRRRLEGPEPGFRRPPDRPWRRDPRPGRARFQHRIAQATG